MTMETNNKEMLVLMLVLLHISILMGLLSCEKQDLQKYDRPDYAIIEVMHLNKPVALVGAVPFDTVRFGDYTIVYHKRIR